MARTVFALAEAAPGQDAEPLYRLPNIVLVFFFGALPIGVFDAHDKLPAGFLRKEVGKHRGAIVAAVKKPRGRRREASDYFLVRIGLHSYFSCESAISSSTCAMLLAASTRANARAFSPMLFICSGEPVMRLISESSTPGVRLFCSSTTPPPARA